MSDRKANEGGQGSKPRQNVKPQLDGREKVPERSERRSKGHRRSRSSDAEPRGRRREREREHRERRERGRSEEGRRRRHDNSHRDAGYPDDDEVETECPVCFCSYDNVFKAPKLLACGHTFCLECLARINVNSLELKSLSCPVCRGLTEVPHGRDLPHLDNNQDVFRHLPPEMQRAMSVRFKRSKGKLVLKNPKTQSSHTKHSLNLPKVKRSEGQEEADRGVSLGAMEEGMAPVTSLDVGRPPNRARGRMQRMFFSNQCYYTVVAAIIAVVVALMLVGILTFVVLPNVRPQGGDRPHRPPNPPNFTTPLEP
ncbi:E3 ubiquitin-protein ligase RNF183 [Chanos chanos]|uniref:E3 ubiquitin-protein ligase RNF183 n=1 Tax=Chanos chanos TaxID=29144 RepID=A0A6J2W460_CHACN|nr:RING finger protein 225-like [Chanos chanos]